MSQAEQRDQPHFSASRIEVTAVAKQARPTADRILDRIERADGCWIWQGNRDRGGYGLMFVGSRTDGSRRNALVHRLSYEEWVGPIPDGLQIDHLCRNRACVNPGHLEPVTPRENQARAPLSPGNRTHCPQGHPYAGENLVINKRGARTCATCNRRASLARAS